MDTIRKILSFIDGCELYQEGPNRPLSFDVEFDSRKIRPGQMFWPLSGANVNGHDFLLQALQNGASTLIIESKSYLNHIPDDLLKDKSILIVPNTFAALSTLAQKTRDMFNGPVVGITGSVGKTTTKEMVRFILGESSFVSPGNQNSIIGLRLSLLKLESTYKSAVFEMGISETGDIEDKVEVGRPDIAAITALAHLHVEGLGGLKEIAKEKVKIFEGFKENNIGIIPGDEVALRDFRFPFKVIRFGYNDDNFIKASNIQNFIGGISFDLHIDNEISNIILSCESRAFVHNALAASAISFALGCSANEIIKGLEAFRPIAGRFKRMKVKNGLGELIDDSYNAGPESMRVALETFETLNGNNKVMVLGDMLELGEKSDYWHQQLGDHIKTLSSVNKIILVGRHVTAIKDAKVVYAKDWKEANTIVKQVLEPDSLVLIKGSRSIGLKNIVDSLV